MIVDQSTISLLTCGVLDADSVKTIDQASCDKETAIDAYRAFQLASQRPACRHRAGFSCTHPAVISIRAHVRIHTYNSASGEE